MGRKPSTEEERAFLAYLRSGRDEMNLLEHSISSANKNVDRTTRSLGFSQDARDPETGEPVRRTWTVTFSAAYGRPVPKDDDVFVALMKVSQAQGLMDKPASGGVGAPQAYFTSRQLIRILGWGDNGRSYRAIDDALNRLCGVRIDATNYFYDNASKLWVDRKFGIIEDAYLYERAKYDRAKRRAVAAGEAHPQSWIRWSDVMYESFQAGYVRKLDIEFYRSLTNPIARKLFRYLGKQFWEKSARTKHEIDLVELCVEKLGYKQGTAIPELQRRVAPAIAELEASGVFGLRHQFDRRYGTCRVVFHRQRTKPKQQDKPAKGMVKTLVELGVRRQDAEAAVAKHAPGRIVEDIEDSAFREQRGMLKKSRAGFLAAMLRSDDPFPRPVGFVSSSDRTRQKQLAAAKQQATQRAAVEQASKKAERTAARDDAFLQFLESLGGEAEREAFADQALAAAKPLYRQQYRQRLAAGDKRAAEQFRRFAMMQLWQRTVKSSRQPALAS